MSSHDSYYRAMTVERDHALTFAVAGGEGVKPGGCAPTSSSSSPKRGDDTSSMRKNSPRAVIINEPTVAECEESIASYYGEARAKKRRAAVDPFGNEASKRVKCLEPISQKATQISTTHEIPDLHGVLPSRLASSFEDYQASPLGFGVRGDWHTAYNAACSAVSSLSGVVITASPGQGSIQCVFDRDVFFSRLGQAARTVRRREPRRSSNGGSRRSKRGERTSRMAFDRGHINGASFNCEFVSH